MIDDAISPAEEAEATDRPLVGVAGASGAAGLAAVGCLAAGYRLRLGARRVDALAPALAVAGCDATAVALDVDLGSTVDQFCAGCRVVVNCVGYPADRYALASAARAAGAAYVDAGGDEALAVRLAEQPPDDEFRAVLGAGMSPGLSGLVPRWLARQGLWPPLSLTVYAYVVDRMTDSSAAEFLSGVAESGGGGHASWRSGRRVWATVEPLSHVRLPFLDVEITAYPHLSAEAERAARAIPLADLTWYQAFAADGPVLPALGRLRAGLVGDDTPATLTEGLIRAAELELFGRSAETRMIYQLDGRLGGEPASTVAVLRLTGTYEVTGTMCALTVAEVLAGTVPPGVFFAADILAPGLIDRLPGRPGVASLTLLDGPLSAYVEVDRGLV